MAGELDGRLALVTGASRGIGAAIAKALAAEGAHVVLTARTVGGLEEVDDAIRGAGGKATLAPVDLTDGDKIDVLGASIFQRFGKLDILIGNAGMLGGLSPLPHVDPKAWERAFKLNVHANFRLIRSFDPLLRASDAGRAVFVTSGAARRVTPYWGVYSATKLALEQLVLTYAAEVANTNLKVNLFSPGATASRMRAEAMPGEDPASLPQPDDVAPKILPLLSPACTAHGQTLTAREG